MDAHRVIQRIVAILVMMFGVGNSPVFADTVPVIYGGDFNLPLLDPTGTGSAMTEAAIEVPGHFIIADLDVRINITHTNVFDLQIFLQGPDKTRICLNVYYSLDKILIGPDYTQTIFDDEAEKSIEEAEPPFTGSFRPIDRLSEFDNTDAYDTWRLQIEDMWPWDTGTLNSFELIFTETPEPATAILLVFATFLAVLKKPQRKL